jgi:RimJ/RimL family protein N-acetyltransferase
LPFGPFETVDQFLSVLVEGRIHPNPACALFAIYDKTRPSADALAVDEGTLAGTIGLLETSTINLSTEIGFILILPSFQRTHVTSNAIGLLLRYALDPASEGGLGLRRVAWKASPNNLPSIRAAERLGFKQEGVARWAFVLPEGKRNGNGLERRNEDPKKNCLGRDTMVLSVCWDEWEDGGRMHANAVMARKQ